MEINNQKPIKTTILRLMENANNGNPNAQYTMALYYKNGTELEKDIDKSIEWGQKSADQGYPHAQFYIGKCYLNGDGLTPDKNKALALFQKSAEQGYSEAINILKELNNQNN